MNSNFGLVPAGMAITDLSKTSVPFRKRRKFGAFSDSSEILSERS